MTANQDPATEWFLARDGQQFGPISAIEMQKLIELGHLQNTDLVWRAGLAEWQPASFAIDEIGRQAAPAPAPEPQQRDPGTVRDPNAARHPGSQNASTQQSLGEAAGHPAGNPGRTGPQAAAGQAAGQPHARQVQGGPQQTGYQQARQHPASQHPAGGQRAAGFGAAAQQTSGQRQLDPAGQQPRDQRPTAQGGAPGQSGPSQAGQNQAGQSIQHQPRGPGPAQNPEIDPRRQVPADEDEFEDDYDDDEPRASIVSVALRTVAAVLVLGLIGGGGWYAYVNKDSIMAVAGLSSSDEPAPVVSADRGAPKTQAPNTLAPSSAAPPETTASVAASVRPIPTLALFETPLWATVKDAFPLWAEQRREAAMNEIGKGRKSQEIEEQLILSMAELRRRHWRHALSSDPAALRSIATVFLDNLKALTANNVNACYGFIRNGEASAQVRPLISDAQIGGKLRQQMHLIMEAIASGRREPNTHAAPVQKDYRLITAELGRIGWTNAEMTLFGDPEKLSKAPPERVCKLVTDWFTAQLKLQDQDAQTRLLVQSLRPVVAG